MFGLATVLFFSVTGLTLNHPDWFLANAETIDHAEGEVNPAWLQLETPAVGPDEEASPDQQVDKLSVVEHLRARHGIRGALVDFGVDDYECMVTFKGPGYAADAFIDRDTGRYQLTETSHGAVAVLNDLHKGRDTGKSWSLLIDISAVLLTVISLSGLILILYLKLRRVPGLVVAVAGTAAVVAIILLLVP